MAGGPCAHDYAASAARWDAAGADGAEAFGADGTAPEWLSDTQEEGADGDGCAAAFAAGEVVWRAGDALDDDADEEGEDEDEAGASGGFTIELSDEWAARFALTEHRRAQRASPPARSSAHAAARG